MDLSSSLLFFNWCLLINYTKVKNYQETLNPFLNKLNEVFQSI